MQPIHRDSIESKTTMLNLQKATEFKSANNLEVVDSTTKTKTVNIIHAQPNSNSENSDLYIMVPNMFVAYDSSNNFTRVFLDVIKSKPVCFDEEGDLVEVFLNDDNIPVTVEENKVNIGYVIRNGEKVFSTEKDNYSSKTLDIDHIKDQIDALGPADPSYATLHHFTDVNSLLKAAYNKLNKTNAVGLVDDTKLAKRHFSQFYIPIPSMGVLYEDEKFHSVMINKTGVPVLFPNTQTNDIVNVYFNFENLPVTIDKNGTIQKGYILVKGSPKFSTTVGDLKELTLNYTLVKEAIDSIGPSYNGYFCLHKPLNLDESIGNVLKEIDVQTSKCKNNKIINKLEHLIKLPGFGVTIDNSENTYFIYLTDDGTPVVSDPSNDNLVPIQFDLQGAPIANISNVLHHGFIEINKQPVYSVLDGEHKNYKFNNTIIEEAINLLGPEEPSYYLSINHPLALHTNLQDIFNNLTIFDANNYVSHNITYPTTGEYYVIPGFGIQLYKDSFYPVIVDSQGNTYCSDNGTLVAVLFDITNLPTAVDRDGQRLKGFIIVNSKPQYSMIIGPTKHITLNLESIKNAITNLGASFFGYSSLYPIDSNGIGTFLKQLSPDTALQYILSKVNISVPEQYIILPGFGVKLEEEEKDAYPLYISLNNGSVAAFNEIGNQFEVKFDSQMRPVVVGNKLLGGFLIFNSVPRQALTTDKLKTMEFDVNVVSKCITNWGPEYPFGYFTLHPIVDIPSDIQAILSSMDVISANGFLNESKFNLTVIPDPYVCIPGFGVKLPNGMDDYYPIFTNNSNVMSFDQNGIGYKVSFDVLNLPITIYNSIVYPGYVFVKGKYRYSVKAGKVHDLLIESQFVVESINKIGPDFIGFTSAYRPLMLNDKLYSFLDQLNVTSANELLNSPVQHKTTKKDLYMIPGMGIENPYESDTKYMPIFVDQVNSVTSFDNNGNVITVLLDIQDIPIAILSDGTKYKGFAMVKGVARFSITNSKTKIFTPDHTLITSTIDRLGETFVGFTSLHPLPDLDSILINSYLDMDIDNALGLVNKGLGLKIDDDLYLAVPAMGIQLTTSKRKGKSSSNRYFPIYVTKANGSLITFDEKRNKLEILVDDNGAPNVYGVDKVLYNGFINVNGEEVFSDGSGRLSKVPVTVDIIQQMVRKLGPKYFGFSMLRINEAQKRMHKKKSSEHNVTK
uniref:BPI2 domain-containing protein n=1 Tax=Rhabditophanes sp. KR3021 TaxID=114890 RepID=A0AC35UCF1_9BILA